MAVNNLICCIFLTFVVLVSSAEEICQSEACVKLSDELIHRSMNQSVAPCDDFYEYVCGNWPAHHPLGHELDPFGRPLEWMNQFYIRQKLVLQEIDEALLNALNSSSRAVKYVAQLYSECVDIGSWEKRGVKPLIESIETIIGSWPMVKAPQANFSFQNQWPHLFAKVFSKAGLSPIFEVHTMERGTVLRIMNGRTNLVPRSYNGIPAPNASQIEKYRTFLQMASLQLGAKNNTKLEKSIDDLIHFELKLAKILESIKDEKDFTGNFDTFRIRLQNRVDWLEIINQILSNLGPEYGQYNSSHKLESRYVDYVEQATEVLNNTPLEVVQNFFGWNIALTYGVLTTSALRKLVLDYLGSNAEATKFPDACAALPLNFPLILGRIYVETHFSAQEKKEAQILVHEIKSSLRQNLANNTWLDSQTREYALKKLDAIEEHVAYPEEILSNQMIDNFYPQLQNVSLAKGRFLENFFKFASYRVLERLDLDVHPLKPPKNPHTVTFNPAAVNAFYNPQDNSISIPAGILQPPFFNKNLPFSMNYGAIGSIIGHEYTHGFDNQGAQYDLHGNKSNWWTKETLKRFEEKTQCFVKQYNQIKLEEINDHINGDQTKGENIADNGGVKESFQAYQAHKAKVGKDTILPNLKLNSDQLFFVSYANQWCNVITQKQERINQFMDPHSPNKYRVNVVLGNSPQFAETFKCPVGSKMNPVHKCAVW